MANNAKHLLVIDWDYFFPNPFDGADWEAVSGGKRSVWLYDWGHRESPMFIEVLWPTRAASFLRHGIEVPRVTEDWRTFVSRFKIAPDARLFVSDSNAEAGTLIAADRRDRYKSVWLYDAHHDSGYGVKSFSEWRNDLEERGAFDCGDWMLIHQLSGSKLNWRRPPWQTEIMSMPPKGVRIDIAQDDGSTPEVTFTDVFVCRSGAWTPPWCDGDFMQFLGTFRRKPIEIRDGAPLDTPLDLVRAFDMESARALAAHAVDNEEEVSIGSND